ncbi:MAG: bifunctional riboflavin kinase/FAD synthetase [Caulobacteraceae bacterium]
MSLTVYHNWRDLAPDDRAAAVAFGNFDGLHLGHQQVIADAGKAAARIGAPLGVVSLEPHPIALFNPGGPPFRLTNPHQLARAVEATGAARLYLLPFGHQMASLSDRAFVKDILVDGLGVRHVAVGFDVTFGKDRSGDPAAMARYGHAFGFGVSITQEVDAADGEKISSSGIRTALRDGEPEVAARLLGRPFAIEGVVQKGQQLGRKLGIPTANVPLGEYVVPKLGVYATRTRLKDGRKLAGVANIGANPTTGEVEPRLEVWIFDFDEDIYGETIETELIAFIRPEEKFASIDAMMKVIADDTARARDILRR